MDSIRTKPIYGQSASRGVSHASEQEGTSMQGFDWEKVIGQGASPENEPTVPPVEATDVPSSVPPDAVAPPIEPPSEELSELLQNIGKPETPEPSAAKGQESEIPFAEHERIFEEAGKSGVTPKMNPFAVEDSGIPPERAPKIAPTTGMPSVRPAEVFESTPPVTPPPTNDAPPVAETTTLPPAATTPVDPDKAKLLSLFSKAVPQTKPEPETVLTLSELNSADANKTSFDAHTDGQSKLSKYDGGASLHDVHIDEILAMAVERKCSDIHFSVGLPPMVRVDGEVMPLPFSPLQPQDTRRMLYDTIDDEKLQKFETTKELDFGYPVKGVGRFRVNMFVQRGSVGGVLRVIPQRIPAFEELGLPPVIREMSKRSSGLVLVTGPTGSGKSTTIAAIIDDINQNRRGHIMTIEDPIEYLHSHKSCIVNQREMHSDTYSFHNALRAVLREDPDIILVGELRDLETIEAALTLAETGHLVFGTLHTRNAPSTIDRIIDVFPPDSQEQIRVLLANTLEGVISQQLLPKLGGGRCASIEIMFGTPAIKNLVREGKTHQMQSILETSANVGMQTMDACLAELYRAGKCEYEECQMRSIDKDTFVRLARAA